MQERHEWIERSVRSLQRFANDYPFTDTHDVPELLSRLGASLDEPPDYQCGRIISSLLLRTCARVVASMHPAQPKCPCGTLPVPWITRFLDSTEAPDELLNAWMHDYFSAYYSNHPITPTEQAARFIRSSPSERWTTGLLGKLVGVSGRGLGEQFKRTFGISISNYVKYARVDIGFSRLCDSTIKVEPLANDLGFRSKKDLYRCLKSFLNRTPGQLRAETPHEISQLHTLLQAQYRLRPCDKSRLSLAPIGRR